MKSIHFLEAMIETFVEFEMLPKFKKSVEVVKTRDFQSLKIPSEATRFQFFDVIKAKFKIGHETVILEKKINHSPVYWPDASIMLGPGGMGGQVRILDKSLAIFFMCVDVAQAAKWRMKNYLSKFTYATQLITFCQNKCLGFRNWSTDRLYAWCKFVTRDVETLCEGCFCRPI